MPLPKFLSGAAPSAFDIEADFEGLGGSEASAERLPLEIPRQERSNWCWSAVGCAIVSYYHSGSSWTQCGLANAALARVDCCGAGADAACNIPWYLDRVLQVTGTLASFEDRSLSFEEIRSAIGASQPVCTRVGWAGGGGHFQVIVGWSIGTSGTEYVDISDPLFEFQTVEYLSFQSFYRGRGRWTHSYQTCAPGARASIATGGRANLDPLSIGA